MKSDRKGTVLLGEIIRAGREGGLQDPGARELYLRWLSDAQARVEKIGTPIARVKLQITCAELCMEMDMITEATEYFKDTLYQAKQERLSAVTLDLERALQTVEIM